MSSFELYLDELHTKVLKRVPRSARPYINGFKHILVNVFDSKIPTKEEIIASHEKVINYLKTSIGKPKTKSNYLQNWANVLKNEFEIDIKCYHSAYIELNTDSRNKAALQPADKKQKEIVITYDRLKKMRDEVHKRLKTEFTKYDPRYVILSLMTGINGILRISEYTSTQVFDTEPENKEELVKLNYVLLNKAVWILNIHKTSGTYQAKTIKLSDELVGIIKEFKRKSGQNWLVCKDDKTTRSVLESYENGDWLKEFIGGSTNMLRSMYCSHILDTNAPNSIRADAARIMGHSLQTALNYYSKFSTRLHGDPEKEKELKHSQETIKKQDQIINCQINELSIWKKLYESEKNKNMKGYKDIVH